MSVKQYELPLKEALDPDATLPDKHKKDQHIREEGVIEEAFAILAERCRHGQVLSDPETTKEFLRLRLAEKPSEVFGCIFLDNRHRLIAVEDLFFGTIDGASVYPREIVRRALEHNAAAILAYHNHPSGITEPSRADIQITTRIKDALALVDIRLLDHLVVSAESATSMAERGLV